MDYKKYALDWEEQAELGLPVPSVRILAAAAVWDLEAGESPVALDVDDAFYQQNPFKDTQKSDISMEFQVRPMGCVHGHNTLADNGFSSLVDIDINVPVSPLFVKDLAGRTVYIGKGPERKDLSHWRAYGAEKRNEQGDLLNPYIAGVTFPKHCRSVGEEVEGSELLESIFMTKFRTLDMAFDFSKTPPSGSEDDLALGLYTNANLYPYKIRLDTFYTDGYKLPQTQMLYARQNVSAAKAQASAEAYMQLWQNRPQGQTYQEFYSKNNCEEWYDTLFENGCTPIPTFEAYNGVNVVNRKFEQEDFWDGRAVTGLHDVVEQRNNKAPMGTILEVIEPGYITASRIVPAKVIVSSGLGYISPNADDPAPMLPNLSLPHQRTTSNWQACWLPTHPEHFEMPALWGWEAASGRFVQLYGPVWDPLHYYYECTDIVINAFRQPMEENRWLVDVPEEMFERFYPIRALQGFDNFSSQILETNKAARLIPRTSLHRIHDDKLVTGLGYHPLPLQYEFELDPFWMPDLHPINRQVGEAPEDIKSRLTPVIKSPVSIDKHLETLQVGQDATWFYDESLLKTPTGEPMEDYEFLLRYLVESPPLELIDELADGLYLEHVDDDILNANPQDLWQGMDAYEDLDQMHFGLGDAVWNMREQAQNLRKFRHKLYRENLGLYNYCWFTCTTVEAAKELYHNWKSKEAQANRAADQNRGTRRAAIYGAAVEKR